MITDASGALAASRDPAPLAEGASPAAKITPDDLWRAALNEYDRAVIWRDEIRKRAAEVPGLDRGVYLKIAAQHARRADMFEKIANLVERAFGDPEILERLREIDREERHRASATEPDAEGLRYE